MNDGTQPLGSIFRFQKERTQHRCGQPSSISVSRWRAIMPKGDEEEIAGRGEGLLRLVALLAPRAFAKNGPTLKTRR